MKKYIVIMLLLPIGIIAQDRALKKASQKFNKASYLSAITIYEQLANRGQGSEEIYEKLGDANYFNANYVKAEQWYRQRYNLKGVYPKEFLYRYGQSLKSAGKEKEAQEILAQYAKENPNQLRAKKYTQGQAQESVKKGSNNFEVKNIDVNSKYSDYSSALKGDTLVFASARPRTGTQIYDRTGQPFTNLYSVVKNGDGSYSKPELFSKSSYSVFHEASPVFSKDGNTMYYTQNEVKPKRQRKAVDGLYKIYKSVREHGKWKSMGVQDIYAKDSVRVAHPALSPDEKTLYFASDGKGTLGQSDIFKVTINDDGSYTAPENLGKNINTEGRESYPFVTRDNILVFASDGHPGMGGFDLFAMDLNQPSAVPVHLNAPLNSAFDDFGLNWNRETNKGVFTSNRPNGQGDDDLYEFVNNDPIFGFEYPSRIVGRVINQATQLAIPGTTVLLFDDQGKEVSRTITDEKGDFKFENVRANANYRTQALKESFNTNETQFKLPLYDREVSTEIVLSQKEFKLEKGVDLGKALSLRHIYFNLDKWDIREDAKVELEKIVEVLKAYPNIKIAIGSHTDSRQTKKYNQELSQKRAQSTLQYLVEQGIDKNRLTAKGYGESRLINKCADGAQCTEEEHQLNRRSTFVIVGK